MKKLILKVFLVLFLCFSYTTQAQDITITGTVLDETNSPLPGASILVKGTSNGVTTDFDGKYSIVANPKATLVFSFVGYKTVERAIDNRTVINLVMEEDASQLDEVVVVGFGTQKKANVTGATGFVEMEDILANRPVTNAMEAIQGTIPGLQILTNSGQPGSSGLDINIRGVTSINGGEPLILMNNVPVSIEDINPQDVASITVLKDASATSIYGARAAFGVVLITTKSPARDQPVKFNYSSTFSFMEPEDIPDKASTYDFINALNDWGTNPFWTGQDIPTWVGFLEEYRSNPSTYPEGYAEFNGLRYPLADTDLIGEWIDDPGFTQIHNFSFSGGGPKTSYRISAGYSDEDGIIVTRNDSYRKYNVNASLTTDLTSKLSSTTNIIYRNSVRRTPLGSYSNSISFNPYTPASGNFVLDDGTEVPYDTPANRERIKVAPEILNDNIRFFQKLDYNLVKGLHLIGEYTFEKKNLTRITSDNQILTANPERFVLNAVDPVNTFFRKQNTQTAYNAFNVYGKYDFDINEHNFSLLAGANSEESSIESFDAQRNNLINVDLPSLSGATGTQTTDDSYGEWAVLGYFGRLNYNYKERYFLELSGRYDGSSRFPKDDRFGFFPSFSAGWHLGKEDFMESIDFLTSLKLRGSWGEIGNQVIKEGNTQIYYPAIPGLGITDYSEFGSNNWLSEETGSRYSTLLLPNLVSSSFTWETVQTLNLGFDASFFNNRLSTSFDWFKRKTLDMLAPGAELPAILGAEAPLENVADLESTGWELGLTWKDKINEFNYSLGFSLSDNQAKITKFDNPAGLLSQYYVGRMFGEIWGYTTDGFYTEDDFVEGTLNADLTGGTLKDGIPRWEGRNQNPGDVKFVDRNGDGIINDGNNTLDNPGDRTIIGNTRRRYQYGFFGNFDYKNFDLSFLLNGVGKRDLYLNNRVRFPYPDEFSVVYQSQLDYWTPDNRDAFFPRNYPLGGVNYGVSRSTQTKYMLNGAYLRMKNITMGYTIPQKLLDKIKVDKLRIYVAAENLFSINDYPDGINTELEIRGNGGIYPYLRSYSVGLNLTF
ncbi:TonB-dependent receptor [Aureibaculum sp. 2210JD6-5]|uniref:SusC/RagA family TonB-linked outer membrane protein n=1 Tax=Aureibaculum sp. 2210JD6-5 TaxID=3103957 RepID=UPI002AAE9205|nr:TonB-dependent receptor [Aureibaculum sp. 2210JD6-5]MDY7396042.1 TonB-dependent receptor [Aureibaculum sp. 2210JD6-5]